MIRVKAAFFSFTPPPPPDSDGSYLRWHRGPTHGPLGIIALGLIVAAIVGVVLRVWDKEAHDRRGAGDLGEVLELLQRDRAGVSRWGRYGEFAYV